ncbi:hypothetical protein PT2222_150305 [Paraburkholderia tropica]
MSWLQKPKPLRSSDSPPRSVSAIDSIVSRAAIAAPMHGQWLAAHGAGSREHHGLTFAAHFAQHVEHHLVIKVAVVVVHLLQIGTVVIDHVGRNTLAEIRLEAIDAHLQQASKMPRVPLPYLTIRFAELIALLHAFGKQRRARPLALWWSSEPGRAMRPRRRTA